MVDILPDQFSFGQDGSSATRQPSLASAPVGAAPAPAPGGGGGGEPFNLGGDLASIDRQIAGLEGQISTSMQGGGEAGPDYSSFYKSPGYDFRFNEGQRALERSGASQGRYFSGGMGRELQRYGQGVASGEFNNYANRLASLAGIGQVATQSTGQMGSNASNQMAQSTMAGGQAAASGIVGSNNAMGQGIQGAAGAFGAGIQQYGGNEGWWNTTGARY